VFICRAALAAVQQVAFADKILLNKIDLVSGAEKANVIRRIRVSCARCWRYSSCRGEVSSTVELYRMFQQQPRLLQGQD